MVVVTNSQILLPPDRLPHSQVHLSASNSGRADGVFRFWLANLSFNPARQRTSEILQTPSKRRCAKLLLDSTRIVGPNSGQMTGYAEAIPVNPQHHYFWLGDDPSRILAVVDCDYMSQFAVSFVADIFPKASRAGTTGRWRRSGSLGRAGSNRSPRDAECRDRTTMR
jgi:hypothetical protein